MTDASIVEQVRNSLPVTQWAVDSLSSAEMRHVGDFLMGLLGRAPVKDGRGWAAERMVLGCLANELYAEASSRGDTDAPAPMQFGRDPVAKARQAIEEIAAMQHERERRDEMGLELAAVRQGRVQAHWDDEMAVASASSDSSS